MGDDEYTSFAIGLHKPFANNQWQWTDGSLVTFINWEAGYDDDDGLATIAFMDVLGRRRDDYSLRNGHWQAYAASNAPFWQGICESKPV